MKECSVLEARLLQRERELALILELDRLRDEMGSHPDRMLGAIAKALTVAVHGDAGLLVLKDDASWVAPAATFDPDAVLASLTQGDLRQLAGAASALSTATSLEPGDILGDKGIVHILSSPLSMKDGLVGSLSVVSRQRRFASDDVALLAAGASQADSAILQARTWQELETRNRELGERNRQLDLIYRIDRVRDEGRNTEEILSTVVNLITNSLSVDLCMLSLVNRETGKNELKAIEDRRGVFGRLSKDALQRTVQWALTQQGVGCLNTGSPLAEWGLAHLMGAPLVVAREPLGSLVLATSDQPFGRPERELFEAVVSQTDSAIVHARTESRLRERNKELETLYRVDHIRDLGLEFGEMLSAVLSELCTAVNAEMGFVMLFDREGQQLELRASTADDILASAGHYLLIEQSANEALQSGQLYVAQDLSEWLRAIMCVPLILRDHIIGVFGAVNHRGPGSFTAEERRLLLAITSQVDTAIFESLDKQRIRETFQRYVGPSVMEQMLVTPERDFLKVDRAWLTVLFSDMRGFTSMTERVSADVLIDMVNTHLGAMTEVVLSHSGTLDKFVADEVMAIFGAPLPMAEHALQAIHTALEMQTVQRELVARWFELGYHLPPIGIGINTGEMVVGNIGCEQQMDYTVMGDVVNLASRLCDAAAGGQILITEETYGCIADRVLAEQLPQIQVKGKDEPVAVYQVIELL